MSSEIKRPKEGIRQPRVRLGPPRVRLRPQKVQIRPPTLDLPNLVKTNECSEIKKALEAEAAPGGLIPPLTLCISRD